MGCAPAATLSGLVDWHGFSQGSSFLATLGLEDGIPLGFKESCPGLVRNGKVSITALDWTRAPPCELFPIQSGNACRSPRAGRRAFAPPSYGLPGRRKLPRPRAQPGGEIQEQLLLLLRRQGIGGGFNLGKGAHADGD